MRGILRDIPYDGDLVLDPIVEDVPAGPDPVVIGVIVAVVAVVVVVTILLVVRAKKKKQGK